MLDTCERCHQIFDHPGRSPWKYCAVCIPEIETEIAIQQLQRQRQLQPVLTPPPIAIPKPFTPEIKIEPAKKFKHYSHPPTPITPKVAVSDIAADLEK